MDRRIGRVDWIDIAGAFAICCVVLNHGIETVYPLHAQEFALYPIAERVFALASFTLGRLGVPIFLMITGYLLIDREWNGESCLRFWKKNWFGLLVCTEIWWVIYHCFDSLHSRAPFDLLACLEDLLFFQKSEMPHAWYMPVILGLYLLLPMVGAAVQRFSVKQLLFPTVIMR